jgi:ABC-type sulfate transport system permease component
VSTLACVVPTAVAAIASSVLAAWVAGVTGLFGVMTNWTLFGIGLALLLVSRAFALRAPRR